MESASQDQDASWLKKLGPGLITGAADDDPSGVATYAKLNGHDPYAYLKDVLNRLPTQRASQIHELLPHRWQTQVQSI